MSNELKLSLVNFQSISHGDLVFHTGTNVIIGQSNSGKTATFRALKACLSNPAGSERFIKKGTNKSSVVLKYNGNEIVWIRTPKESSYIINGEEFIKTGKSNAFKLLEDTGFAVDSNDTIMNIEEELQLPFPFGISKTDLFKLYENVFCVSDSAVILKAANGKETETKDYITSLENDIIKNENKIAAIAEFKKEVDIKLLEEQKKHLTDSSNRIQLLQEGLDIIHKAIKIQNFKVDEVSFENKTQELQELRNLKEQLYKLKKLHTLGKELKEVEAPAGIDLTEYQNLKNLSRNLQQLKEIKNLKVPEETFLNKFEEYEKLKSYALSLETIKYKIKERKEELKKVEEFIQNVEESLKEFKVCPLCHKPLD